MGIGDEKWGEVESIRAILGAQVLRNEVGHGENGGVVMRREKVS